MQLDEARIRLKNLLRDVCRRPEVDGGLADELDQLFCTLRNYAYFVDFQRKELAELCQEMDQL